MACGARWRVGINSYVEFDRGSNGPGTRAEEIAMLVADHPENVQKMEVTAKNLSGKMPYTCHLNLTAPLFTRTGGGKPGGGWTGATLAVALVGGFATALPLSLFLSIHRF